MHNVNRIEFAYDGFGRVTGRTYSNTSGANRRVTTYTYQDVGTDKTTTLVQSVQTAAGTYTYTYDAVGNILSVSDGTYTNSYVYDSLNQLVRENNQKFGKTYTYAYVNGNITERKEYAYTTGELGAPQSVYNWSYGDGTWSDLLTAWNEGAASSANASSASAFSLQNTATSDETAQSFFKRALQRSSANSNVSRAARTASTADTTNTTPSFSYDEIGNPTEIFDLQFSWNGRQLTSITASDDSYVSRVDFGYNMDGQRISRIFTAPDGTVKTTEYFYNGENLAGEQTGDRTVVYMYDNSGDIFGFTVNGRTYYYVKNAQNDVTAITDSNGTVVVYYYYDAWGEPNYTYYACNGQTLDDVQDNPILYRSYYYDIDVGFYYLNTRYYVPMFCRFLSSDGIYDTHTGMLSHNMFAYCNNNPVNMIDSEGAGPLWNWLSSAVSSIINRIFGNQEESSVETAVNTITTLSNSVYGYQESVNNARQDYTTHIANVVDANSTSTKPKIRRQYHNNDLNNTLNPDSRNSKIAYCGLKITVLFFYDTHLEDMTWEDVEQNDVLKDTIIQYYSVWDEQTPLAIASQYGIEYSMDTISDIFF